ncbi:MAG: Sir2 family NAD-dependent protein deacetylase [Treponemataceae bacterium]
MNSRVDELLVSAALAIASSRRLVAFTGAGISVESGIPPFRGPGGLWERYDPSILDIQRFNQESAASWKAIKELFYDHWSKCEPNLAHRVLADWEARGLLSFTITQNIDDLHYRSGNRHIAEYHGSLRDLVCRRCGKRLPSLSVSLDHLPPLCPDCGAVLKPDFVFFGEGIPEAASRAAAEAIHSCDCLLMIGTSGEVYPAASLPPAAKRRGAVLIELNPRPSAYTASIVDYFLPFGACEGMEKLNAALLDLR